MVVDLTGLLNNSNTNFSPTGAKSFLDSSDFEAFSGAFEKATKKYADKKDVLGSDRNKNVNNQEDIKQNTETTALTVKKQDASNEKISNNIDKNVSDSSSKTDSNDSEPSLNNEVQVGESVSVSQTDFKDNQAISTSDEDNKDVADNSEESSDITQIDFGVSIVGNIAEVVSLPNKTSQNNEIVSPLPIETIVENLKMEPEVVQDNSSEISIELTENLDIDLSSIDSQSAKIETVTLEEDSKIVVNLEGDSEKVNSEIENNKSDTSEKPMIKVSEDLNIESKDTQTSNELNSTVDVDTSNEQIDKAKEKADTQMSELQDSDIVVTESSNSSDTSNSDANYSSSKQNANEQIAKMSVENAPQGLTTFSSLINDKVDASFASKNMPSNSQNLLNQADIMDQVNSKLADLQSQGTSKVSIVLRPENLGRVVLEIANTGNGIVAKMSTENHQVKEIFDKNIEVLKANLSNQGVNVNNIKVECSSESQNNGMNFDRQQFGQGSFQDSQRQNEKLFQSGYSENSYYGTSDEQENEYLNAEKLQNHETIIEHNGKVDYKV